MKQKQVKICPNVVRQGKSRKKATPAEESRMEVDESDNEADVEQKQIVAKTPWVKKAAKVQDTVAEQSSDEEEQDLEQSDEVEEDEEASDEEGDDDDEEHEQDENGVEDNDDEAPSVESIEKDEPTIPSEVKMGPIPETVPYNRVIRVYKLPKECNKMHLIEAFAKYGTIAQINILKKSGVTIANIAYKTEKAALAAFKDDKKVKVLDVLVRIKMQKRTYNDHDRSVIIKNIKTGTSEEELRQHFEPCGKIEAAKLFTRYNELIFAFITFTDKSAIPAALKLHGSVLNGVNMRVTANNKAHIPSTNERLTVLVKNTRNFENIDVEKLKTIFSKCGEISILDVVCKKDVLAFITFKNEISVEKALKLSGKTEEEIELDLELYDPFKKWTSIHVYNLSRDCTEEDLTNVFSKAGEIVSIKLKNGYAKIDFKDCEGYCKSFLYNETFIRGKIIFIKPHSIHKPKVFKSFQNIGFKRPAQNC